MEIESIEVLIASIESRGTLDGAVIQGLDLEAHTAEVCSVPVAGAVFLGCALTPRALAYVTVGGALVFPRIEGLPYKAYRSGLYTLDELMEGYERGVPGSFEEKARDSQIYRHFKQHHEAGGEAPIMEALAQRLHDHAIDDGLGDLLHGVVERKVVAIMGGHAMTRDEKVFGQVALMARELARRGFFIATGGGPGAMEAGNLGAWFAPFDDDALAQAIEHLAKVPSYKLDGYIDRAYEVLDDYPEGGESLAIPTWFYGHEPTNQFARHIAKYFSNSIREDGLLAIASHGVIYAPGSAGTIQEVFMDAAQNHYGTFHVVSPMVFFGGEYWRETKPVYPLMQHLAEGRQYGEMLTISDSVEEIVQFIVDHPPAPAQ